VKFHLEKYFFFVNIFVPIFISQFVLIMIVLMQELKMWFFLLTVQVRKYLIDPFPFCSEKNLHPPYPELSWPSPPLQIVHVDMNAQQEVDNYHPKVANLILVDLMINSIYENQYSIKKRSFDFSMWWKWKDLAVEVILSRFDCFC